MRFLWEAMLGGLAKRLRAAGHDAYYAGEGTDVSDGALTRKALREGRVLLTGDGGFLDRRPVRDGEVGFLLVPNLPPEDGLRLVVGRFGLARRESRCMRCNGELDPAPRKTVSGRVPPGVLRGHADFFVCRGCGRVFWHGSHWDRIGSTLSRAFG